MSKWARLRKRIAELRAIPEGACVTPECIPTWDEVLEAGTELEATLRDLLLTTAEPESDLVQRARKLLENGA